MNPEDSKTPSGDQTSEGDQSPNIAADGNVTINYVNPEHDPEEDQASRKEDRKFGRNTALMAAGISAAATIVVSLFVYFWPSTPVIVVKPTAGSAPPALPDKVSVEGVFTVQSDDPIESVLYSHMLPYEGVTGLSLIGGEMGPVYKMRRVDFDRNKAKNTPEFMHRALVSRNAGPAVHVDSISSALTAQFCTILNKEVAADFEFKFSCELPGTCKIDAPLEYFSVCPGEPAVGFLDGLELFSTAYANVAADIQAEQYIGNSAGWIAPSLQTLRSLREQGYGFTEFKISSGPIDSIENAKWIALAVRTNDTPVYFDGLPPKYNPIKFEPSVGINIKFGLENLAFRGKDAGTETIDVDLYFLDVNGEVVASDSFSKKYIALRDSEPTEHSFKGATVRWEAKFLHASSEGNQFTVTLLSSKNVKALVDEANYLTDQRVAYDEIDQSRIVGVVRPPLGENPRSGVVAGLEHASGKIQFTFDQASALRLCKWMVQSKAKYVKEFKYIRTDIYTYEIGPGRSITCG